jgi:MerR family transcriptional regulator, heat shock protein HspR
MGIEDPFSPFREDPVMAESSADDYDDDRLQSYCSVEVAAHLAGLSVRRVHRLVRCGVIQPPLVERGRPLFGEVELVRLRKIRRLTTDLGVNLAGVEVILRLTDELYTLRAESAVSNQTASSVRVRTDSHVRG